MHLGVMATIDDADIMSELDVEFLELLVREQDTTADIIRSLESIGMDAILHAPEMIRFQGGTHLLDLASVDLDFRRACQNRIREVSRIAEESGIPLVVHPGGVLPESFVDCQLLLSGLLQSLEILEGTVWIENMPRIYHMDEMLLSCNLLVGPEEASRILEFVDGLVLDVSHAYLSVEEDGNAAIARFFNRLGRSVSHVHLSDARRPDVEGVQIGEGEIDFSFVPSLERIPILLEIWGGHENQGEGFRKAIERIRDGYL